MTRPAQPARCSHEHLVELYFMEHRAKLLDIAAFLDRLDRAQNDRDANRQDFRLVRFRQAIELLIDGRTQRARRILDLFSDPTTEPVEAAGQPSAYGAWPGAEA